MKKTEYQKLVDATLKPTLIKHGFVEVKLTGCMRPEVLYQKNNLWFGTSWDRRDQYLELDLGHLYWFRDVMPRVIVLGNYSAYCREIDSIKSSDDNYLVNVADTVVSTLQNAISVYTERYEQILSGHLEKKSKYANVFLKHLGNEVSDAELSTYKL
jgi:hypothetical protein